MSEFTRPATWEDVRLVARLLSAHGVEYALVGAYALAAHGYVRFSEDVDILVDPSAENTARWIAALSELPDGAAKELAGRSYDRSFYPEGIHRQLAAVAGSGPRTATLPDVKAPTLVIHGRDDRLIVPSGGERTAELIPGASFLLVADMGHDLPEPLWPLLADVITSHIRLAAGSA